MYSFSSGKSFVNGTVLLDIFIQQLQEWNKSILKKSSPKNTFILQIKSKHGFSSRIYKQELGVLPLPTLWYYWLKIAILSTSSLVQEQKHNTEHCKHASGRSRRIHTGINLGILWWNFLDFIIACAIVIRWGRWNDVSINIAD